MIELILALEGLLFLYAFSDDITYALAKKKLARKAKKALKNKSKGSEDT